MPAAAGGRISGSSIRVSTSRVARKIAGRQEVGGRRADRDDDRDRDQGGLEAQAQRIDGDGIVEAGEQLARADIDEDRHHRERQEAERERCRADEQRDECDAPRPRSRSDRGLKPASSSAGCPSPLRRPSMNFLASAGWSVPFTTAAP